MRRILIATLLVSLGALPAAGQMLGSPLPPTGVVAPAIGLNSLGLPATNLVPWWPWFPMATAGAFPWGLGPTLLAGATTVSPLGFPGRAVALGPSPLAPAGGIALGMVPAPAAVAALPPAGAAPLAIRRLSPVSIPAGDFPAPGRLMVFGNDAITTAPLMEESGQVMVPLLSAVQAAGGTLQVTGNLITVAMLARTVTLQLGQRTGSVDGAQLILAAPPAQVGGLIYVPLGFFYQAFSLGVAWAANSGTAAITR